MNFSRKSNTHCFMGVWKPERTFCDFGVQYQNLRAISRCWFDIGQLSILMKIFNSFSFDCLKNRISIDELEVLFQYLALAFK